MSRSPRLLLSLFVVLLCGWTTEASAASFIIPDDEVLIDRAEAIVTGTVRGSVPRRGDRGGIETIYTLDVDEVLKGSAGAVVELREWGGVLDGEWMVASGSPRYSVGSRYLVFLLRAPTGSWTTLELALGQFRFVEVANQMFLTRELGTSYVLGMPGDAGRSAPEFLSRIRDRVSVASMSQQYSSTPTVEANDLDTRSAATKGVAQWSSGSSVNYTISGAAASGSTRGDDGEERIIIGDPNGDIPGSFSGSGTIATAFFGGSTLGFTDRVDLTYSDIVVQDGVGTATGVTQEEYATVLTHELGHTIGFRHSNQNKFSESGSACAAPLPCSGSAVMNSFIISGLNGVLQTWDRAGLSSNYGSAPDQNYLIVDQSSLRPWYRSQSNVVWRISGEGGACSGPKISSGPVANPSAIELGQTAQLVVSATSSVGSLQYQWYRGTSGNTGSPVPGGTANAISVKPTQTSSYWVRVSDSCGSVDSVSVQIFVIVCEPVITSQPKGKVIGPGETTTLAVTAANATSYSWYAGSSGDISRFVGGGSILSVSPSQTTSYWVRVGNSCGSVDSGSATVQVLQCPPPSIVKEPVDIDLQAGEKATLQVVADGEGELRYEWYRGLSGDTSSLIASETDVLVLENIGSDLDVWARVYGECGYRDTRTAHIRLVTICTAPAIAREPGDETIFSGARALLQVEATGTSLIYQWFYRPGATTLEVKGATGPTLTTEPLFSDRTYFVRVRNNCGGISSRDATVTVSSCTPPSILSVTPGQRLDLGSRAELDVVVDGTAPIEIEWFEGESGDLSHPIEGADDPVLAVGPLGGTVRYWVRVSNSCGSVQSETIELRVDSVRNRPTHRR